MGSENSKKHSPKEEEVEQLYTISCFGNNQAGKSLFVNQLKRIHQEQFEVEKFDVYEEIFDALALVINHLLEHTPELIELSPNKDVLFELKREADAYSQDKYKREVCKEYVYKMMLGTYKDPVIRKVIEKHKNFLQMNDGVE